MVPLANPRTEADLISLASTVAKQRGGTVDAVHVVQVPDQTSLEYGAEHVSELDAESEALLESARADAETFGVDVETRTIISHRAFEEIFDAARRHEADLVVMGWGPDSTGRAERPLDELTRNLPCDFLVLNDRWFDPERILVPTAGGPDSDLSAEIARVFRDERGAEVTLLHAVRGDETEAFLGSWAEEHGLGDARRVVSTAAVETAIEDAATDHTLVIIGATERGLLARLVRDSLHMDVVDDVDTSVLLAERPGDRSLLQRLIGRR